MSFELSSAEIDFTKPVTLDIVATINGKASTIGTVQEVQLQQGKAFNFEITKEMQLEPLKNK